jgi:hypothetical protein
VLQETASFGSVDGRDHIVLMCIVIDRKASRPARHGLGTTSSDVIFELSRGVHQLYTRRTVVVTNPIKDMFK